MSPSPSAELILAEMREFAAFSACEQRYIRRSLDVGLGRADAFRLWARNGAETASIRGQYVAYQDLKLLRRTLGADDRPASVDTIMGPLLRTTMFDLAQERLTGFCAYRFCMNACWAQTCGPGCPVRSAVPPRCRRSAPNGARSCSSRSAKPLPPHPAGRAAHRFSCPNSWNWKQPDTIVQ